MAFSNFTSVRVFSAAGFEVVFVGELRVAEDESARHVLLGVAEKPTDMGVVLIRLPVKRFCVGAVLAGQQGADLALQAGTRNHRQPAQRITNDRLVDRADGGEAIAGPDLQARQDGQCPGYLDLGVARSHWVVSLVLRIEVLLVCG